MHLYSVYTPDQSAWAELLMEAGLKHDRPMIEVHGYGGITYWAPGGLLKESQILERYPMPEGWKAGDGLPPGFRF
ncbi:hypothetical protein [uncultured Pseudacidovorax sp.]|uniref:hypothetical protein n=1 Tax=uncultured Pseudacidovorax sp. TaxID=679313 RepID=UPI0025FB8ED1|nr:hypothetical protein [uncultured Pseudacidovorax sp.]